MPRNCNISHFRSGLLACALFVPTFAQAQDAPSANQDAVSGESAIVVTGTRRAGVSELSSTTPISVVSGTQLQRSAVANLGQALQTLSPSINFPQNRANTVATSTKQVSLRGLSPDETLVMVNGHRWYASAGLNTGDSFGRGSQATDLAALPVIGLSRVEVLRDGASAQYGSDAVAGVVNVVLRSGDVGGEVRAQSGIFSSGEGQTRYIGGWYGFKTVNGGVIDVMAEYQKSAFVPLNKSTDTRQYYTPTTPAKEASAPLRNWHTGLGENDNLNIAATLDQPLSEKLSLYALGNYSRRSTAAYSPTRLPNSSANVLAVTPDGYQLKGFGKPRDYAGVAGLRYDGDALGKFDLSFTYGQNDLFLYSHNSENPSYGINTPRDFYLGKLTNRQFNLALDYVKEFDAGTYKPLTFSAGVTQRWDAYRQKSGDPAAYSFGGVTGVPIGVTGGGFIAPEASQYNRDRRSTGGYLGLEGEAIKDLTIGLAGRVEHFSDFGTAVTGKASLRYAFSPAIAVRGSISNAFKAPSIGQLSLYADTPVQITPTAENPSGRVDTLLVPSDSALAAAAGGKPLKPEKSLNLSGGFVLTPAPRVSLTVDGYYIRIKDRIALSAIISGTAARGILAGAGYPSVYGIQYFLNMGKTTTRGIDAVAAYKLPLSADSSLDFSLSGTFNKNKVNSYTDATFAGSPLVNYYSVLSLFYEATPKWRGIGSVTYSSKHLDLNATGSYYGRYGGANNQAPGTQFWFDPIFTVDLSATFKTRDQFEFTLGARNVTGVKPEMVPNSGNGGRLSNSSLAIINPGGAYLFAAVAKKF